MNGIELFVIVVCLIAGYWGMSKMLAGKAAADRAAAAFWAQQETAELRTTGTSWNEILGVSPVAGLDEIRHAYKDLIVQYHPDKVANLGLELRALADEKSKQITAAYHEGIRARGGTA